jgi:hypothetical protein
MNRLREAISIGISDSDDLLQLAMTVTWLALDDLVTERPTSYVIERITEYCEIVSVRGRNLRRAAESMPFQKTERRYDN